MRQKYRFFAIHRQSIVACVRGTMRRIRKGETYALRSSARTRRVYKVTDCLRVQKGKKKKRNAQKQRVYMRQLRRERRIRDEDASSVNKILSERIGRYVRPVSDYILEIEDFELEIRI